MKQKDIRLIAMDLDGTLFSSFGTLSPLAEQALKELKKKGIRIVISTGRPLYSVRKSIPDELYDYAACLNGQDIWIPKEQRHIKQPDLTEKQIDLLCSRFRHYPLVLNASTETRSIYICSPLMKAAYFIRDIPRNIYRRMNGRPKVRRDLSGTFPELYREPIGKICFSGTHATLQHFSKELSEEDFSWFYVSSIWMEIMSANVSKGNALRTIQQLEGLSQDQCAAIGDGDNDLPLMEAVGTKVAMKNAMPSILAIADDIALHYKEDGCAKWIIENLLTAQ